MSDPTRRRLLGLSVGAACALAGCSSVVGRLGRTERSSRPATRRPPETPLSTPTARPEAAPGPSTDGGGDPSAPTETPTATPSISTDPPNLSFVDAPVPHAPRPTYATMGAVDATPVATLYGSWKCPYTREFVRKQLDDVVDTYVRPGDLALQFRDVAYLSGEPFLGPDAPRSGRYGLGVWNVDPESFWSYFAYVFENQPQERFTWGTRENLGTYATAAGVDGVDQLADPGATMQYTTDVHATSDVVERLGLSAVPRIVVGGEVTAPGLDPTATRKQLDRAVTA